MTTWVWVLGRPLYLALPVLQVQSGVVDTRGMYLITAAAGGKDEHPGCLARVSRGRVAMGGC